MLEGLGLNEPEEAAYLLILDQPPQTFREVAARLESSTAGTRAVLRVLEERGLIIRLAGRPARYVAMSPDEAVERLVDERLHEVMLARAAIPRLVERFHGIRRGDSPADLIEVVTDRDVILQRWIQQHKGVQHQLRAFDRPPYLADPNQTDVHELDVLRQGLTCRVIYDQAVVEDPKRWPDIEEGVRRGEQARIFPSLPVKLTIFDDRAAIIAIHEPGRSYYQIHFHAREIVQSLGILFEATWERADPLQFRNPSEHQNREGSTERQQRILALMAAGFSDDALGRALTISRSTIQRAIRDLMDQTHSKTRFQAGIHVQRLGLLPNGDDAAQ